MTTLTLAGFAMVVFGVACSWFDDGEPHWRWPVAMFPLGLIVLAIACVVR